MTVIIDYYDQDAFARVRRANAPDDARLSLIADMCRYNALSAIKRAGSGHIGTSFSSMELFVYLYESFLNLKDLGIDHPDRDIFFSSKGHDAPGQYAVLHAAGILPTERFLGLRRLNGVPGHPEIGVPGIEANTGSLGMGLSKARGIATGKRLAARGGRVIVMLGDGELQEGQNYEALRTTVNQGVNGLIAVVDANKVQSDKLVTVIGDLGDLERKIKAFGWAVERCDGHNFSSIESALAALSAQSEKPGFLIADTVKGKGVSFMEHTSSLRGAEDVYCWHSGAPDDTHFARAAEELSKRISASGSRLNLNRCERISVSPVKDEMLGRSADSVTAAVADELCAIGVERADVVVLDADLSDDCGLRKFEQMYTERFFEHGIAEQDMVSMAGGLAAQGFVPILASFGAFLAARANEQIYNNACERRRIVYLCQYAGLLPAGPGHSHQSVRDVALFGSVPGVDVIQPCNEREARMALRHAVFDATESCMIRLSIIPSPRVIELPADYRLSRGRGCILRSGGHAIMVAYGPVMLDQCLRAAEILAEDGIECCVVNMPWLNRFNGDWLDETMGLHQRILIVDDHGATGGLGERLTAFLAISGRLNGRRVATLAIHGVPICGTNLESLRAHGLNADGIATALRRIQ